jgi:hypothetical protein
VGLFREPFDSQISELFQGWTGNSVELIHEPFDSQISGALSGLNNCQFSPEKAPLICESNGSWMMSIQSFVNELYCIAVSVIREWAFLNCYFKRSNDWNDNSVELTHERLKWQISRAHPRTIEMTIQ